MQSYSFFWAIARAAFTFLVLLQGADTATASDIQDYSREEWRHIEENCAKEAAGGPFLYSDDFQWDQTREELEARYQRLYTDAKRLKGRAFFDVSQKQFVLEMNEGGSPALVPVALRFLRGVQTHIEEALRLKYVDAIIFSDMGHSHFFMPDDVYQARFSGPGVKPSE